MHLDTLIADSGSTKAVWAVLKRSGAQKIVTQGISPYFLNTMQIKSLLQKELLPSIADVSAIREVHYYGTGCTAPAMVNIIHTALEQLFPQAFIHVDYDLVAAAHALCGRSTGIVCILGTGSNSGYFDGVKIQRNSPGLGYILGDEGSGAHLGKKLLTNYFYGKFDSEIEKWFQQRFQTSKDALLEKVYSTPLPNRFLASFSTFFSEHRGVQVLEEVLREGLDDFFRVHISTFDQCMTAPVHFTGGIAWAYRDVLEDLCARYKYQLGTIIKEPMTGLIDYYRRG